MLKQITIILLLLLLSMTPAGAQDTFQDRVLLSFGQAEATPHMVLAQPMTDVTASTVRDAETGDVLFTHCAGLLNNAATTPTLTPCHNEDVLLYWNPQRTQYIAIHNFIGQSAAFTHAIFDGRTGELLHELQNGSGDLHQFAFYWSPDGNVITDEVRFWHAQGGHLMGVIQIPQYYADNELGVSSTADFYWYEDHNFLIVYQVESLATGTEDTMLITGSVFPFELEYRQFQQTLHYIETIDEQLVLLSDGYEVNIDRSTLDIISVRRLSSAGYQPTAMVWSPDSTALITLSEGSPNYPMQRWDIDAMLTGSPAEPVWSVNDDWLTRIEEAEQYGINQARISWSDDKLVTVSDNRTIFFEFHSVERWNPENGMSQGRLYFVEGDINQNRLLATPSYDLQYMGFHHSAFGRNDEIWTGVIATENLTRQFEFNSGADFVVWNADNSMLVARHGDDEAIELYSVTDGISLYRLPLFVWDIIWSPDSRMYYIYTYEESIVLEAETGERLFSIEHNYSGAVEWRIDSRILASGNGSLVQFYDAETGELLRTLSIESDNTGWVEIQALAWSPDGTMLAVATNDGVHILDVESIGS